MSTSEPLHLTAPRDLIAAVDAVSRIMPGGASRAAATRYLIRLGIHSLLPEVRAELQRRREARANDATDPEKDPNP